MADSSGESKVTATVDELRVLRLIEMAQATWTNDSTEKMVKAIDVLQQIKQLPAASRFHKLIDETTAAIRTLAGVRRSLDSWDIMIKRNEANGALPASWADPSS